MIWLRNSVNAVTPSIIPIFILIQVVTQVENIVNRILSHWVTVCIKETEGYRSQFCEKEASTWIGDGGTK